MSNLIDALETACIVSHEQAHAIRHIKDRVAIIDNQLGQLYGNPLKWENRINNLEEQKGILENAF